MQSPYFKVIPTTYELKTRQAAAVRAGAKAMAIDPSVCLGEDEEEYLATMKRLTLEKLDTDSVYGLTEHELVPLPFEAPRVRLAATATLRCGAVWQMTVDVVNV